MKDIFTDIYKNNAWSGRQSRSGTGSDLEETGNIRRELPLLVNRLRVKSILDIPCGDLNWVKLLFETFDDMGVRYIGADLVPELVEELLENYQVEIMCLDVTENQLPGVDLVFTRDCLGHLSNKNVDKAVENIKRARPKYFIATHWPKAEFHDIHDGGWRPINMEHYLDDSFKLLELIEEDVKDKYLGVWAHEPN